MLGFFSFLHLGSPPPMRGKVTAVKNAVAGMGITPAYAGKSDSRKKRGCVHGDHPRLCGEKNGKTRTSAGLAGAPPPMRGKVNKCVLRRLPTRITPAYAGKRSVPCAFACHVRDHPRLCGEKFLAPYAYHYKAGSPPPMRGKVVLARRGHVSAGITPAYAGKRRWSAHSPTRS